MNFGMRAHDMPASGISELSDKLSEYGVKYIQLALKKSMNDIELKTGMFSPGFAWHTKDELEKNNIRVAVLGSYINPVNPDDEERKADLDFFVENLKYAKFIGAGMVGTETGFVESIEKTHSEETYGVFLSSMKVLKAAAENLGVLIGVEAVHCLTVNNPQKMKRFLDDINSENFVVILDVVNMLNTENYKNQREIMDEAFLLYKDKIAAVHIKDFKFSDGALKRTVAGEGEFDFEYLFSLLKKHKPHISMIIEETNPEDFIKSRENLEKIYEKV